tara:strand:+ start:247 stop:1641 length:1395 start_codon:yes stop_codon:yes gene_type:complete
MFAKQAIIGLRCWIYFLLIALLVQGLGAAQAAAVAKPIERLRDLGVRVEPYVQVRERRRHDRWRKLHHFPMTSKVVVKPGGWYLTFDDRHIDDQGRVRPKVLKLCAEGILVQGLSVRNTELNNAGLVSLGKISSLLALDLNGTYIDDDGLKHLAFWPELLDLDLGESDITDVGLRHLKNIAHLEVLVLAGGDISDAGISHVAALKQLQQLILTGCMVTRAGIAKLTKLPGLDSLGLGETNIRADDLQDLNALAQLRVLDLFGTATDDRGMRYVRDHRGIVALNLGACEGITDEGVLHLSELKTLRGLLLRKTGFEVKKLTGEGVRHLSRLTSLEVLDLHAVQIDDKAALHLKKLKQLREVDLSLTQLTDEGLAALASLQRLERLALVYSTGFAGPQITDQGVVHLAQLEKLKSLNLIGAKITDRSVELLVSLKRLEHLILTETEISVAGLQRLRQALPRCKIQE